MYLTKMHSERNIDSIIALSIKYMFQYYMNHDKKDWKLFERPVGKVTLIDTLYH